MAKYQRNAERLLKLLIYILGRHPDEFGLVPDNDGYVKIKDLLKAVCEEDGWRHVRLKHIDDLFLTLGDPPLERDDNLIRTRNREKLLPQTEVPNPPRLLYTCVRQRAYPVIYIRGITGMGVPRVILSSDRKLAERIGRRYDRRAVLLTVNTRQCQARGIQFFSVGERIFWAGEIPQGCFSGPPVPEQKPSPKKPVKTDQAPPTPGSFILDPFADEAAKRGRKPPQTGRDGYGKGGRKKITRKRQPPPWRS